MQPLFANTCSKSPPLICVVQPLELATVAHKLNKVMVWQLPVNLKLKATDDEGGRKVMEYNVGLLLPPQT